MGTKKHLAGSGEEVVLAAELAYQSKRGRPVPRARAVATATPQDRYIAQRAATALELDEADDPTDILAGAGTKEARGPNLKIYFYHIPSGKEVSFKAFLTSFSDSFESEWNSELVYGRMDPIETFQGTKRVISIAWDVVAFGMKEAVGNMNDIDMLISMLYPTYEGTKGGAGSIISSPLFKLKFANLVRQPGGKGEHPTAKLGGLVGRLGGITYEPILEEGVFASSSGNKKLYPQAVRLACDFTVFHTHKLGWRKKSIKNKKGKEVSWVSSKSGFPHGVTEEEPSAPAPPPRGTAQTDAAAVDELLNSRGYGVDLGSSTSGRRE
tara:strand:- start:517 stop:1488 length:972 start_codon:yes stop_codon:yes gene_type:complete